MRARLTILVASCLSVLLVSCEKPTANAAPLRVGIETWAGYAFAYLAEDKGFFEQNGVEVELVFAESSAISRDRFARHEIDGWFDVLTEAVSGHAHGIPARVVWIVDYSDSADVLVGDSKIAKIEDLAGKRIGIEGINTFSHMFALELMAKHGVPEEQIQFEIVNPMDVSEALKEGQIDAGHTWEPVTTDALANGYKILGEAGEIPGLITDVLLMSPRVIESSPDQIQAVVAALAEAVEYWRAHPEESLEIMARHDKMSTEQLAADLSGLRILDLTDNLAAMDPTDSSNSVYAAIQRIIDFFSARGQLLTRPEADLLVEPRFIRSIAPSQ